MNSDRAFFFFLSLSLAFEASLRPEACREYIEGPNNLEVGVWIVEQRMDLENCKIGD